VVVALQVKAARVLSEQAVMIARRAVQVDAHQASRRMVQAAAANRVLPVKVRAVVGVLTVRLNTAARCVRRLLERVQNAWKLAPVTRTHRAFRRVIADRDTLALEIAARVAAYRFAARAEQCARRRVLTARNGRYVTSLPARTKSQP
jgi:hypothetical protein